MISIWNNVWENALVSTVIAANDYVRAVTQDGRAQVCDVDGRVRPFLRLGSIRH